MPPSPTPTHMFTRFFVSKYRKHVTTTITRCVTRHRYAPPPSAAWRRHRSATETGPSLGTAPSYSWYGELGTICQAGLAIFGVDRTCVGSMVMLVLYYYPCLSLSLSPLSLSLSLSLFRSLYLSCSLYTYIPLPLSFSLAILHVFPYLPLLLSRCSVKRLSPFLLLFLYSCPEPSPGDGPSTC